MLILNICIICLYISSSLARIQFWFSHLSRYDTSPSFSSWYVPTSMFLQLRSCPCDRRFQRNPCSSKIIQGGTASRLELTGARIRNNTSVAFERWTIPKLLRNERTTGLYIRQDRSVLIMPARYPIWYFKLLI